MDPDAELRIGAGRRLDHRPGTLGQPGELVDMAMPQGLSDTRSRGSRRAGEDGQPRLLKSRHCKFGQRMTFKGDSFRSVEMLSRHGEPPRDPCCHTKGPLDENGWGQAESETALGKWR